jgi:hypothetical protein
VFVQPVGSGTTLQLDSQPCLDLPIVVSDTDSTEVSIAQEAPMIAGATIKQTGAFSATWHWCPTAAQVAQQDRYFLSVSASDGTHSKVVKTGYVIVLVGASNNMACPGQAPVILYSPIGAQGTQDIPLHFEVSDDLGVKNWPTVYWSMTAPSDPIDFTKMTAVTTTRVTGDASDGTYSGTIPNHNLSGTVYYVLSARDTDDPTGACNHRTLAPATGSYSFSVGSVGLGMCQACTSDSQCGGPDDNCIVIGSQLRCGQSCDGGCPNGAQCSLTTVHSIDGVDRAQCVPVGGTCS